MRTLLKANLIFAFIFSVTVAIGAPDVWAQKKDEPVPLELDKTEWEVEMVHVDEKGKKDTASDMLKFIDNKFISEQFEKKGYDPTNYSLTTEEDGSTKFGTMQIKGKETSFWKGVVEDKAINGSVHTQFANGSTKTTYFTGELTSGVLKPKSKKKPTPPPPPPPPKPVPPAPEPAAAEETSAGNMATETAEVPEAQAVQTPSETAPAQGE